jgi:ribosomal protein L37AE/L43A
MKTIKDYLKDFDNNIKKHECPECGSNDIETYYIDNNNEILKCKSCNAELINDDGLYYLGKTVLV